MVNKMCGKFIKGHLAWNKGKKGLHLSINSEFRKGLHSSTFRGYYKPSISIRSGSRKPETYVTTPDQFNAISRGRPYLGRKRVSYARYLWEKHNGRIPDGMVVYNRLQDPLNIRIENLILITRAELVQINNKRDM
jgi:hypothetical protein